MDSVAWPDPAREWPSCLSLCLLFFPLPLCFFPDLKLISFISLLSPSFFSYFLLLCSSPFIPFSLHMLSLPLFLHSRIFLTVAYLLTLLNKPDCHMLYPLWCTKDHASPVQFEQPVERTHLAQDCFHTESK